MGVSMVCVAFLGDGKDALLRGFGLWFNLLWFVS